MKTKLLYLLLLISGIGASYAQFEFHQPNWYAGKGFQKLYVKVGDQSQPYTKKIMQLIKENWTLCSVEFYTDKLDTSLLVDGNLFLNFERYSIASQYVRDYGNNGGISRGQVNYNDYYYLNFWVIDKKYKPKNDWWDYRFTVAKSEFYLKTIGLGEEEFKMFKIDLETMVGTRESVFHIERQERYPKVFDFTDASFQNNYLNGMEGNLKNMLQFTNDEIKKQREKDFFDSSKNETALSQLKSKTLFIPNYWYGAPGTILENVPQGDKYIAAHEKFLKDLKSAYPMASEIITRDELNTKILTAKDDFYYLNYIQSSADKIVSVVNGKTGEVIYSEVTKNSYRLKEKDIEKLAKQIK